jgi:uncharacterized SAM-binding protein YcdF (DUF218 family)
LGELFDKAIHFWRKYCARIWRRVVVVLTFLVLIFILFGRPILRGVGNFLIAEDEISQADAIFVLGGNNYDRSLKALDLLQSGWAPIIYTLGENVSLDLTILGYEIPDAILSQEFLMDYGLSLDQVIPLVKGTSTLEESEAILSLCREKGYSKIIVVSDKFHLRRISFVFKKKFSDQHITVLLAGAPNSMYNEQYWWQFESGLIMLNNEYVKLVYYAIKGY